MIQSDSEEPGLVHRHNLRVLEALLFAAEAPLGLAEIALYLGEGADVARLLSELEALYAGRGVNLVRRGDKWAFRTAEDLSLVLTREEHDSRPLSRAALEILAIIAYHQPCTRAEVEEIRGVASGGSTFELLMQTGWVRMRGRRRTPGRPVTYGTTEAFLDHFGLESVGDLPGLEELKGAGLLTAQLPQGFQVPLPFEGGLRDDEDALEDEGADALAFPLDEAP